jgi:hypothetical protein
VISSPSVLDALENESIEIFRETAAAFRKPVMLYSIGKDSSVLLHLARKAFAPGPIPFPLMHIDTTWKFKEMISFRDETATEVGFELLVQTNQQGIADGVTGQEYSIRDFASFAFGAVGLDWEDFVRFDKIYLRPAEISSNKGDPGFAGSTLSWRAETFGKNLAEIMVRHDEILLGGYQQDSPNSVLWQQEARME